MKDKEKIDKELVIIGTDKEGNLTIVFDDNIEAKEVAMFATILLHSVVKEGVSKEQILEIVSTNLDIMDKLS